MAGYLAHWIGPFALGYAVYEPQKARKAVTIYFAVFSFVVALALLAYFGLFPKTVHGDFHLVKDGLLQAGRSHIALGALCIFITFFLAGFAFEPGRSRAARTAMLGAALVYIFAIALTGSRGYYISAGLTFSVFGIFWAVKNNKIKQLFYVLLAAAAVSALIVRFNPQVQERILRTNKADNNLIERVYLYKVAFSEIRARPFFGYGPGQAIRQKEYFEKLPPREQNLDRHPALHSFYLNFAADFGLAGLAIFVIIMAHVFKRLASVMAARDGEQAVSGTDGILAFGLFWGLIGLLIGDCFDTLLRGPGVAMELFWVLGMVFGISKETKN
jgi:O-antigen ligase